MLTTILHSHRERFDFLTTGSVQQAPFVGCSWGKITSPDMNIRIAKTISTIVSRLSTQAFAPIELHYGKPLWMRHALRDTSRIRTTSQFKEEFQQKAAFFRILRDFRCKKWIIHTTSFNQSSQDLRSDRQASVYAFSYDLTGGMARSVWQVVSIHSWQKLYLMLFYLTFPDNRATP